MATSGDLDVPSPTITNEQTVQQQLDHAQDIAVQLEHEKAQLRGRLTEAAELIAWWGAYASDYFQEKWDLAGDVSRINAVAAGEVEAPATLTRLQAARSQRDQARDIVSRLEQENARLVEGLRKIAVPPGKHGHATPFASGCWACIAVAALAPLDGAE